MNFYLQFFPAETSFHLFCFFDHLLFYLLYIKNSLPIVSLQLMLSEGDIENADGIGLVSHQLGAMYALVIGGGNWRWWSLIQPHFLQAIELLS